MKKKLLMLAAVFLLMLTLCCGVYASAATTPNKTPNISVSNTAEGVNIKWNKISGAQAYSVYKKKENGIPINISTQKTTEYTDKDVENGTDYTYYVKVFKNSIFGNNSKSKTIRFVSMPKITSLKSGEKTVTIKWKKVSGAQEYYVYKKKNGTDWKLIKTVDASGKMTHTDKNIIRGTTYYYTVKCKNAGYSSSFKAESITVLSKCNVTSVTIGQSAITVKWSSVKGADKYVLYKKTDSGEFKKIKTFSSSVRSYNDTGVKHNKKYTYKVVAKKSDDSSPAGKTRAVVFLKPGTITSLTSTKNGISVKWKKGSAITGYTLYKWSDKNKSWTKLGDFTSTSYTDKKVSHGKKYTYTLVQYNKSQKSAFYPNGFSTIYMKAPTALKATAGKTVITLSWKKVSSAKGYTIQRKIHGSWTTIGNINSGSTTSFKDKNFEGAAINEYRVCAFTLYGKGCYSSAVKVKAKAIAVTGKKLVALTFDDGPYAPVTNKILDCLKKYNSKATFFVVGSRVDAYQSCIKRIANEGHEFGNHTFDHLTLTTATPAQIKSEIDKTNSLIKKHTGKTAKIVRAPGGAVNDEVKKAVPYPLVNWSVDTLDWKYRDKDLVVAEIKKNVSDGSIVLMHDLYTSTGEAACEIIPWLRNNGYELVTVSELMRRKGVDFTAGKLYYRG